MAPQQQNQRPNDQTGDRADSDAELFRLLAENVKDYAIIVLDVQGRVRSWLAGAERMLGYRAEEIVGQPGHLLFTPEDVQNRVPEQEMEQARTIGGGQDDRWHVRKDGSRFWSSDAMTPLWDEAGQLRGFAKVMRDRTEWKELAHARRQSEASKSAVLDTALDAILTIDRDDRIVEFNPAAERLFGHRRAEVLGQKMGELIVPPHLRAKHYQGLAHYLATGEGPVLGKRLELSALRADGTEFPVELAISRVPTDEAMLFTGYIRDITEQKAQQHRRAAQLGITQVLAEAATIGVAAAGILEAICGNLNWDVGGFWLVDRRDDVLRCTEVWRQPTVGVREFEDASRQRTLADGEGLPGRVWQSRTPLWLSDVTGDGNFPRLHLAAKVGVRSAFAVPILLGEQVLGVVEFLSRSIREPDADLLGMMATIGGQIGQFLQRKHAEVALRESEERFRGLMEQAPFSVQVFSPTGQTLQVNQAWEQLWGVSIDQVGDYNILEDPQLAAKGALEPIRRAFAGEAAIVPAIQYDVNDTVPGRTHHADPRRWVSAVAYPLKDPNGQVSEVILVHEDITARKQAEDALRESEERFRGIVNYSIAGVVEVDLRGRFLFANERYCTIVGRPLEELLGMSMQEISHPDDLVANLPMFEQIGRDGVPYVIEKRYIRPDGSEVWVSNSVSGLKDQQGRIKSIAAVCVDVTDRRRAEQARREGEDRLHMALDAGQMGTWHWDIRTSEVRWSPQLERIHGLPEGSFPGTFEAYQQDMHPEDRPRVLASIQRALGTGQDHHIEYRLVLPDGSIRWVEARGKLFRDSAGEPLHMIGVCSEITERKRAEQDLRFLAEASRSLAAVVDYESMLQKVASLAVPDFADWCVIYLPDEEGRLRQSTVAHVDPAKVQMASEIHHRWPPNPSMPRGVYEVLRTGQSVLVEDIPEPLLREAIKDDEHFEILRTVGMKSYICVPLALRDDILGVVSFIAAESGRRYTRADLALAEDLARRAAIACDNARLYATLREEGRKKDEFLAMLAHELRNPLAPIRTGLDLLAMEGQDAEILGAMQRQVEHLVRLVDDLLDVSRIMRGKVELRKEPVELSAIVERAAQTVRSMIEANGQRLSIVMPPEPIWLHADAVRLAQVVGNLLNNASKYTEAAGEIALSAELRDEHVVVCVRDTGIGISPDLLPHVFDLFTQDQRTIDRSQGGLGIGLTVVKSLVEMHGGSVAVASEGPGLGSQFSVRLPTIASPHGQSGPAEIIDAPPPFRILVVDDNVSAARMLGLLLAKLGNHQILTAYDGATALNVAKEHCPDLILLDIGLPKLDGFEVARQLRQVPHLKQVRIVALTGYGAEEDRRRSLDAGFDEHHVKPLGLELLKKMLARAKPERR